MKSSWYYKSVEELKKHINWLKTESKRIFYNSQSNYQDYMSIMFYYQAVKNACLNKIELIGTMK